MSVNVGDLTTASSLLYLFREDLPDATQELVSEWREDFKGYLKANLGHKELNQDELDSFAEELDNILEREGFPRLLTTSDIYDDRGCDDMGEPLCSI